MIKSYVSVGLEVLVYFFRDDRFYDFNVTHSIRFFFMINASFGGHFHRLMKDGGVAGATASTGSFQPIMSSYTAPPSEVKHPGGPKVTPDSDDTQPSELDSCSTTWLSCQLTSCRGSVGHHRGLYCCCSC